MGIEGYAEALWREIFAVLAHGTHIVRDARTALVRQFVGHEVSAIVGEDAHHLFTFIVDVHLDAGSAGAVVEAHIAIDAARVLALAHLHFGRGRVTALAVIHAEHLVFVGSQRRHAGVLIAHIIQEGSNLFPSIVALTLHAAHHREVVDGVAVGVPGQQHAALASRRHQCLVYRTRVLVVEVGKRRLGDLGVNGFLDRRGFRNEVVALLRPAVGEILCKFCLSGTNHATAHHRHHFVAIHLPLRTQILGQIVC